ncbi:hypothetical protein GCM10007927_38020 [Sulfitobacter pacificus]|uniref:Uncharacterized protein n=1 Tax=Sulfitobacter pacificus TaxID=1499314 RepID=A0ABQ5VPN2_9RHOB|nr:hypothetical protein GCM10007927_38020 [Sulfitobacter pacificus]
MPAMGVAVGNEGVESGDAAGEFQLHIEPKRRDAACHYELALRGIGNWGIAKDGTAKGVILRSDKCGFLNGVEVECGGHRNSPGRAS